MDFCELVLSSNLLSEGVYTLEITASSEGIESLLVTPSFFREDIGEECYRDFSYIKNSSNDLNCYSIFLTKPSFLPIFTESISSLLQNLILLQSKNDELFIQLLFSKRSDQWQHKMIECYSEYLKGNDFPSNNRVNRSIQRSLLKVLDKVSGNNLKRTEIKEISEKILDEGYRFELRLITKTNDVSVFESELNEILIEYDFFNMFSYQKIKNKQRFIDNYLNRSFSNVSKHQILSEKELISIITDEKVESKNKNSSIIEFQEDIKKEIINTAYSNIDLLPIGVKKDRRIDKELVTYLPAALQKAKAIKTSKLDIVDVELGANVQRITFKIPKGHVYSDIKSRYEDIKSTLGTELNIIQGKEANTITFLIPCSQRDIIYLKELLESESFQQFAQKNPLPFICGVDMYNEPVYKCLTKAPHLLVVGGTNSGKSVFINTILMTFMLLKLPNELRLVLIDPKKVELNLYEGLPHVDGNVIKDMSEAIIKLDSLIKEMEYRYEMMSEKGVKNIAAYNRQSKSKLPYIVTVIDEYNDLRLQFPDVEKRIERLGQKARASGIHLIIATQTPNKDVMSNTLKTNLPSRVSFKLDNSNEYKTVFGTGIPYRNLLGFGDGVVKYVAQVEEFIRFQAPVITLDENEEEKTFVRIKKLYKGEQIERLELANVKQESDLDKLKKIIANTNETRFSRLREELGKGSNIVKSLMNQLVEEGWLSKPESKAKGYQLIINEDELDKWRSH
ncbi:FtsK/SpoIIIE domain-containing protein [Metabacillus fastidiosus]|uniref:FtsK/SpoIIIE domain-containing protein n=1 Tax=Metabacillus fastidiosus TaxID=1458 RepID=UPI003D2D5B2A